MQRKRAEALRDQWKDKTCDHPTLAREYDAGERTGSYVCAQCGKSFSFRERAELFAARGG